ncbi:hypothetical protein C4579_01265 [Candidatus Microgenomates bacterium]|nr:MAG: hypothetical protein C4579_01265 [Candidatus Microgenomates bacterium]
MKKINVSLLLIIFIALFFRLYHFYDFQYWSSDEELLTATIRHIVWDRSPTLLVQNAALEFGLGPFYHYLLTPWYALTHFNLVALQIIPVILGVVTTLLLFFSGKELENKKLGLLVAFIYASSFFIGLYDRRLVHITLNPILSAFTFLLLAKISNRKYQFIPLLAIPIGFALHEDASLFILTVGIVISWLVYKFPFKLRQMLLFGALLAVFLSPFVLAEIRYQGVVSKGLCEFISKPSQEAPVRFESYSPVQVINTFGRIFFATPTNFAEKHFFYQEPPLPLWSPLPQLLVLILLGLSLWQFKQVGNDHRYLSLCWILLLSFVVGLYAYHFLFRANFYQHYYTVIYPIVVLLVSHVLYHLLAAFPRYKALVLVCLSLYFLINVYSLMHSRVAYSLSDKINLVRQTAPAIGNDDFAIYASGDPYIHGGGWTELYTLYFKPAVKSYHYKFWEWIYMAYSLYPTEIQDEDPEKLVVIHRSDEKLTSHLPRIFTTSYEDVVIEVLDNTSQTSDFTFTNVPVVPR